jgi:hypothetical protein
VLVIFASTCRNNGRAATGEPQPVDLAASRIKLLVQEEGMFELASVNLSRRG